MSTSSDPPVWRPPGADSRWSVTTPLNAERPEHVPLKPQGSVPVIAHLLWATHEEFMPGRAVRWTAGHVMVALVDVDAPGGARENYVWLPARDVFRTLPRRPRLGT
ncbi:hypothetical protein [Cellulosimicrobium sp. Marseille-Q8652]